MFIVQIIVQELQTMLKDLIRDKVFPHNAFLFFYIEYLVLPKKLNIAKWSCVMNSTSPTQFDVCPDDNEKSRELCGVID